MPNLSHFKFSSKRFEIYISRGSPELKKTVCVCVFFSSNPSKWSGDWRERGARQGLAKLMKDVYRIFREALNWVTAGSDIERGWSDWQNDDRHLGGSYGLGPYVATRDRRRVRIRRRKFEFQAV